MNPPPAAITAGDQTLQNDQDAYTAAIAAKQQTASALSAAQAADQAAAANVSAAAAQLAHDLQAQIALLQSTYGGAAVPSVPTSFSAPKGAHPTAR